MPSSSSVSFQTASPSEFVELLQPQQDQILRGILVFLLALVLVYAFVRFGVVRPLVRFLDERDVDPSIGYAAGFERPVGAVAVGAERVSPVRAGDVRPPLLGSRRSTGSTAG